MQLQNSSAFLIVLTFACQALIACAKQLDIMDGECGDGNYGTILAQSANAIKLVDSITQLEIFSEAHLSPNEQLTWRGSNASIER